MMKKYLLGILAGSLSILNFAYAQPTDCPAVSSIQGVGVSPNVLQVDNAWFAGRRNQMYDTPYHWTFVIVNIIANDAQDAFNKASSALGSLNFQAGPVVTQGKKVCTYTTDAGYTAFAMTPPILSFAAAKSFL